MLCLNKKENSLGSERPGLAHINMQLCLQQPALLVTFLTGELALSCLWTLCPTLKAVCRQHICASLWFDLLQLHAFGISGSCRYSRCRQDYPG